MITLYTPGHLQISWDVFAKKSADIMSFRNSFITISTLMAHFLCKRIDSFLEVGQKQLNFVIQKKKSKSLNMF